jgi:hypothetical protein
MKATIFGVCLVSIMRERRLKRIRSRSEAVDKFPFGKALCGSYRSEIS